MTQGQNVHSQPARMPWPQRLLLAALSVLPIAWNVWKHFKYAPTDVDNPDLLFNALGVAFRLPLLLAAVSWLAMTPDKARQVVLCIGGLYLVVVVLLGIPFATSESLGQESLLLLLMAPGTIPLVTCALTWGLSKLLWR